MLKCASSRRLQAPKKVTKRILILKTGTTITPVLERGEDFEQWFIQFGSGDANHYFVCNLQNGEVLPDLDKVLGIIITGSAANVTAAEAWTYAGADYLRAARHSEVPMLGVCYGHQLIAWTFGGVVEFHARGREIGTEDIRSSEQVIDDILFCELPRQFKAQVSHQQTVTELPVGAVHLAGNAFEPNQAFRLGQNIWGVQFHPEFTAEVVRTYIEHRAAAITEEGLDVAQLLAKVTESEFASIPLQRFTSYCLEQASVARV